MVLGMLLLWHKIKLSIIAHRKGYEAIFPHNKIAITLLLKKKIFIGIDGSVNLFFAQKVL